MSVNYKRAKCDYAIHRVAIKHPDEVNGSYYFDVAFPIVDTSKVQDAIDRIDKSESRTKFRLCAKRRLISRRDVISSYPSFLLPEGAYIEWLLEKASNIYYRWFYKKDFLDKIEDRMPDVPIKRY